MECEDNNKCSESVNGIIELKKVIDTNWHANITTLNLSHQNIITLDENIKLPANIIDLNISHNNIAQVPCAILNLETLKSLDISYNRIQYFDEIPVFTQCIESLNLANNLLKGPPYWIWCDTVNKLVHLDLSCNPSITNSFEEEEYYKELLRYTCPATNIVLFNCKLRKYIEILKTFPKAKILELGTFNYSYIFSNELVQIPCKGIDKCCDIQRLNVSNSHIYTVASNLDIYINLVEINLGQNSVTDLPKEFCNLECLEICILSDNEIMYLPDDIIKLKKLVRLHIDSNRLCILPEGIGLLHNLVLLDLYNNCLYEVPASVHNVAEIDLAQNFLHEPDDNEYLKKKNKLRLRYEKRWDGNKKEIITPDYSNHSLDTSDDEELIAHMEYINLNKDTAEPPNPPSSPEDWDSDDYWVPSNYFNQAPQPHAPWMNFVRKRMEDGNFCPMDVHPVSISEQVKYQNMIKPRVWCEVEGQFDDYE